MENKREQSLQKQHLVQVVVMVGSGAGELVSGDGWDLQPPVYKSSRRKLQLELK